MSLLSRKAVSSSEIESVTLSPGVGWRVSGQRHRCRCSVSFTPGSEGPGVTGCLPAAHPGSMRCLGFLPLVVGLPGGGGRGGGGGLLVCEWVGHGVMGSKRSGKKQGVAGVAPPWLAGPPPWFPLTSPGNPMVRFRRRAHTALGVVSALPNETERQSPNTWTHEAPWRDTGATRCERAFGASKKSDLN